MSAADAVPALSVFVVDLTGDNNDREIRLDASLPTVATLALAPSASVAELQQLLALRSGCAVPDQRLLFLRICPHGFSAATAKTAAAAEPSAPPPAIEGVVYGPAPASPGLDTPPPAPVSSPSSSSSFSSSSSSSSSAPSSSSSAPSPSPTAAHAAGSADAISADTGSESEGDDGPVYMAEDGTRLSAAEFRRRRARRLLALQQNHARAIHAGFLPPLDDDTALPPASAPPTLAVSPPASSFPTSSSSPSPSPAPSPAPASAAAPLRALNLRPLQQLRPAARWSELVAGNRGELWLLLKQKSAP